MRFRLVCALTLVYGLLVLPAARADFFTIQLKIETADSNKVVQGETLALGTKPKAREVFTAKAAQKITVRWTMTNSTANKTAKNLLVHFVVVKQEKIGQLQIPKLTKGVVVESAVTVDSAPKDVTSGELTFTIDQPGAYLVRLQTSAPGDGEFAHFAALDVAIP